LKKAQFFTIQLTGLPNHEKFLTRKRFRDFRHNI